MCTAAALFLLAASAPVTWARDAQICITSAVNLPASDEWPKKPAPEAWVKVEIGGRQLCKTSPVRAMYLAPSPGAWSEPGCRG